MRWVLLLIAVVFNVAANLLLKAGAQASDQVDEKPIAMLLDPFVISGVVCSGMLLVSYTLLLRHFPVGVAYPIVTSLALVFVFFGSVVVFEESISASKMLGVILIVGGVILLGRVA